MTLKAEAEALRIALISGFMTAADVVRWADAVIAEVDGFPDEITDVSLARDPKALISALARVPGTLQPQVTAARLFAWMRSALEAAPAKARVVVGTLREMALAGLAPMYAAEVRMASFEDRLELAERGSHGTAQGVFDDLRGYLRENSAEVVRLRQ